MRTHELNGNLQVIEDYNLFSKNIGQVFEIFAKCFGKEIMTKTDLYIDNATEKSGYTPIITPVLEKYLIIKLGIDDFKDEERIVYQFSHELCHYVFFSLLGINKDLNNKNEESICSAMSLVIIKIIFSEEIFKYWCNNVSKLKEDYYQKGLEIAKNINFDLNELKKLIFDTCSK